MKRMHVHIGVENLKESRDFYANLFNATPTKEEKDYVQWKLEDPVVNFAISTGPSNHGLHHLGIQVDSETEMENLRENFRAADITTHSDGEAVCCYARGDKSWIRDPSGIAWETFRRINDETVFACSDLESGGESCPTSSKKIDCC